MRGEIHVLTRGVLIDKGHILLCKTVGIENNFYFLPGGHVELDESAQDGLIREMLEETGKNITITRFLGCLEHIFKPKTPICHHHEYNLIFEIACSDLSADVQPTQCEEHVELHFIPLSDLGTIPLHPSSLATQLFVWLENKPNLFETFFKHPAGQ